MNGVSSLLKLKQDVSDKDNNNLQEGKEIDDEDEAKAEDGEEEEEEEEEEYGYHVGDFVWGKIKNHPWWPGQIYDPSEASDLALKIKQKMKLLVVCFGDGTFAWYGASKLKPFVESFKECSNVSNSRGFVSASCGCAEEKKHELDNPEVKNAGLKEGVVVRDVRREMSKTLVQPVEQKRLTNVAVVRLKKQGNRFEIACYKNKIFSWRSGVKKDIDEVLQSHTVYSNVLKRVLAKSKDLIKDFGSEDHTKICLEILDKGELQVAGKKRESQFSSQFRDIATIVMQKTINPETQRPYTISMVERLMHEVHFAVDSLSNSKKQALDVICELQKHFPIKCSPMRLCLTVHVQNFISLLEKLKEWDASVFSKDESGTQMPIVCEMEPGLFRECDSLVRNMQGRLEILDVSVHAEGDTSMDHYDEHDDMALQMNKTLLPIEAETDPVVELSMEMQKQEIGTGNTNDTKQGGE